MEIMSDMRTAAAAAETALGPLVGTGFLGSLPQLVQVVPAGTADGALTGVIGPVTPLAGAGHVMLVQAQSSGFAAAGLSTMTIQIESAPAAIGPWTLVERSQVSGVPDAGVPVGGESVGATVIAYTHPPAGVPIFYRLAVTTVGAGGTYTMSSATDGMIAVQQL